VRKALDAAGLTDATIAASNELNEDISIEGLLLGHGDRMNRFGEVV